MPALTELQNGKVGLLVGIANEHSIATGCAHAFQQAAAQLAITSRNEKSKPYVEPVARSVNSALFLPLDVEAEGEMETVYEAVANSWGGSISSFTPWHSARRKICKGA